MKKCKNEMLCCVIVTWLTWAWHLAHSPQPIAHIQRQLGIFQTSSLFAMSSNVMKHVTQKEREREQESKRAGGRESKQREMFRHSAFYFYYQAHFVCERGLAPKHVHIKMYINIWIYIQTIYMYIHVSVQLIICVYPSCICQLSCSNRKAFKWLPQGP